MSESREGRYERKLLWQILIAEALILLTIGVMLGWIVQAAWVQR